MNTKTQRGPSVFTLLFWFAALVAATLVPSCAKLQSGGAYTDNVQFQAEQTIRTGYDLLNTYVTWEKENRLLLSGTPAVKQSADAIRKDAKQWFATANNLRDAYVKNPTEANKAALQKALDVINQAVRESLTYFLKLGPGSK